MKKRKKRIIAIIVAVIIAIPIIFLGLLYFYQEKLFFHPVKLGANYAFEFDQKFEEIYIQSDDGTILNGILFQSDTTKGVVFYLHGNAGSIRSCGKVAQTYTNLNYDIFVLDYRGFGKSEGKIKSEEQLYSDSQIAYDELKKRYDENDIIIEGYSIGTGLASELASKNNPKLLILKAPYYSFEDLVCGTYHLPEFLLRYKIPTNEYLEKVKAPVIIFHGTEDKIINYDSSLKLEAEFKEGDTLITLEDQGHGNITSNESYKTEIAKILE
ncbi:MAG TPA: alpha/beta fold hydrolase [Bacteroidales bacterium]|nr:alpha/beta fold hydrolase [Bacteroidales bacterium]HPK30610.1 alpha/beta fold hydrolase [Bacteroidales bacterium]